ncbi:putative DNA repair protein RAD50 [Triangularia verruculosa]|uniref:DNA repair protein RAD50 n=1 Tax=Triangularia verruculosa TaxID=2587418 RepID=A0AAN7B0K0_9PEZI|nr:putative DNA repair protein RAD50 [Triangularia verruculosa]
MSRIEKLSILGVRSFSPHEQQAIAFNTPLTLIVGYNGSGKTTVIECLKYATTGELPPNSKGGAFIHEPELEGEKDVRAQVKVSFRSTIGEQYVLTRNVQLTVKKNTRSMKTLEGSLLLRGQAGGKERHVISTRVMELDKLVPEKLGVSPAVLEAVIFCHQDESLWPMSEPSALKKKFDEIFEAMKYTKVIDNLKVLRKRKGEELRELKIQETQDKVNKERADKVGRLIIQMHQEIQEATDKCSDILKQMKQKAEEIKAKHEEANSFLKIVNDLQNKTEKLEYKSEAIKELRSRIEELPDTDQVLRNTLDEYAQTIERTVADRDRKAAQYHALQADLKQSREKHTAKVAEQGKHQSDKDKYERQLVTRDRMVHEAAERHEIRGYDGDLDDDRIESFYERIQKALNDKKRELERLQRSNAEELDKKSSVIAELEARKQSLNRDRTSAKQRIMAVGRESATVQSELSSLDVDEGSEAALRAEMKEVEARIETAKADEQSANLDDHIKKVNDEIWQLETQSAKLGRELVECTRLASERAQLDLRKKQLTDRRRDLDILKNTWSEQLSALLGASWTPATVEAEFQNALRRQDGLVAEARKQKDATQQELKQVEYKLSTTRDRHSKLSTEMQSCQRAVLKALHETRDESDPDHPPVDDYEKQTKAVEEELAQVDSDIKLTVAMKDYYIKVQTVAEKHNKCNLCERDFHGQEDAKRRFFARISKQLGNEMKDELESDKAEFADRLRRLQAVRTQYDTYKRLEKEVPTLSRELNHCAAQKEDLVRRLEDKDLAFSKTEEKRREMDALNKNVLKISQHHKDIQEAERQVERSQQSSSVTTRSPEEINEEQTTCAEQIRVAQAKLSKLTIERQRLKDLASQLEVERLELRHRISTAVQQLERKKSLQDQIRRFKEEQAQLRESVQTADSDLEALEPEMATARSALDEVRQHGRAKEQNVTEERDAIAGTLSELKMINSEIQEYLERGGPSNLLSNQRTIAALESSIINIETEMKDLTVQINKLNKEIDNSDAKKRNISDNLTYRKNLRERVALQQEIKELESRNAQEDYDRLSQEARYLEDRRGLLTAERERLMGNLASKDDQLKRLQDEFDLDLKGAKAKYKESHIKVETTKAAIDDLGRGTMALDHAIMQFHSLKMEEINRIIGELWRETYQGTDIDTIQIRSDVDAGAGSGGGKRNYNYRVSMVKGDTDMDMRGRCSAGQKVLASIIIRLALAESFGVNCGLIALDEPTTNLDSDNIRSLAMSLHRIIKARQSQGNLQLIVITHDEEFLKHMRCQDFCDTFYRVERNAKQNSVIRVENITRISE